MKRVSHPEVDDQPWLPRSVRDGFTDYLRFMTTHARPYQAVVEPLADALRVSGATTVVDLASGGGGPWPQLRGELARRGVEIDVVFTDRYPNLGAADALAAQPELTYHREPVDARDVPADLRGFRTMFSAFHHFEPHDAVAILRDAAEQGDGIAIVEAVRRSAAALALAPFVPLPMMVLAPFIRPFRWSRLAWTYAFPLIPMALAFDALASVRKAYTEDELLSMARTAREDYEWRVETAPHARWPISILYLIGLPVEAHTRSDPPGASRPLAR